MPYTVESVVSINVPLTYFTETTILENGRDTIASIPHDVLPTFIASGVVVYSPTSKTHEGEGPNRLCLCVMNVIDRTTHTLIDMMFIYRYGWGCWL